MRELGDMSGAPRHEITVFSDFGQTNGYKMRFIVNLYQRNAM